MAYLRSNLIYFKSYFGRYLVVAILIAECLNTSLETDHFSTNLINFDRHFVKIDKYLNNFRKLGSLKSKKIENIFKNNSKNF